MSLEGKLISYREEKRKRQGKRPPVGDDGKPVIRIEAGETIAEVDRTEEALLASEHGLYKQGNRIVRIIWDNVKVAGGGDAQVMRLSRVGADHLFERFSRAARFEHWDGRNGGFVPLDCPRKLCDTYLARDGEWKLPYILGVVSVPLLKRDGSILEKIGYDEATGIVYDPRGVAFPAVKEEPTREDALAALAALKEPLRGFSFAQGGSASVALSGIMTTVVRRALRTAPMHAYSASTAGAGKSMLVDIASLIATGTLAAVTSPERDKHGAEELGKRLAASMLAGDAVLSLDNMEDPLGGQFLNQIVTQTVVKIRKFGVLENVEVPSATSMFATGNNLIVAGDMTRRVLVSTLEVEVERPELRRFDFDALELALAERPRYVHAVLTVIRAYLRSKDEVEEAPLGSFKDWSRMVRDPLIWLGEADPVDVMEQTRKGDPRLSKLLQVTGAWEAAFGDAMRTVAEVIAKAQERYPAAGPDEEPWANAELRTALLAITSGGEQGAINPEKLSWWLRKNLGRIVEGRSFERDDEQKYPRWSLRGAITPKGGGPMF